MFDLLKKRAVYFRIEAGKEVGLGHLYRCLALADMIKADFTVYFLVIGLESEIVAIIQKSGFVTLRFADQGEWLSGIDRDGFFVLDGYNLNDNLEFEIRNTGASVIRIDDTFDSGNFADLVINHSPGANSTLYDGRAGTLYALGLDYVLLRPPFLNYKSGREEKLVGDSIFICFGGSDTKNLTKRVLSFLFTKKRFKKYYVATGVSYAHYDDLKLYISKAGHSVNLYNNISAEEMAEIMKSCSVAIVPASGIMLEAMSMGLSILAGAYISNQSQLLKIFSEKSLIFDVHNFEEDLIEKRIVELLSGNHSVRSHVIDGRSGVRLLKIFNILNISKQLELRFAKAEDVELTYRWAIDPVIRKYSFNQHIILPEEHSSWFLEKVKDSHSSYFIVTLQNTPLGAIRFDLKGTDAIISYHVDSGYHGSGIGLAVLKAGIEKYSKCKHTYPVNRLVGYVHRENIASIRIFERFGFTAENDKEAICFTKEFK